MLVLPRPSRFGGLENDAAPFVILRVSFLPPSRRLPLCRETNNLAIGMMWDKIEEGRLPNQVTRSSSVYKVCREKQPYILIFSFRYLFWSVSLRRVFSITLAFTPTELFLLAYFSRSYSLLRLFSNLFRYTRRQEQ